MFAASRLSSLMSSCEMGIWGSFVVLAECGLGLIEKGSPDTMSGEPFVWLVGFLVWFLEGWWFVWLWVVFREFCLCLVRTFLLRLCLSWVL